VWGGEGQAFGEKIAERTDGPAIKRKMGPASLSERGTFPLQERKKMSFLSLRGPTRGRVEFTSKKKEREGELAV